MTTNTGRAALESIGAAVRSWRGQRGWTRTRLAAETRIPLPTISDIEAGWEGASTFQLKRIWGALGIYSSSPSSSVRSSVRQSDTSSPCIATRTWGGGMART